ncbi:MAG: M28 family peptidase, partial [Gammaproteobacteria bacterium]|nr:M28 family peptidase [Gammaproteobacteria bacterium]
PGSQRYTPPFNFFYPDKGDFIAFVGNLASRSLVHDAIDIFRKHAGIPSEGVAAPAIVPGIGWSDHWAFWMNHYPAIMITDTAPFRYPYYHHSEDTPDKLDYQKMARVVMGVRKISEALLCI